MKLLISNSYKYKNKQYVKYWIIIPNSIIEKLHWKPGIKLDWNIKKDKLGIKKNV